MPTCRCTANCPFVPSVPFTQTVLSSKMPPKSRKNEILVRVNNTASPADRWYSGCGIYRTVKWVEVNERHLFAEDVTVRTEVTEKGAFVHVKADTDGDVRAVLSPPSEEPEGRGGFSEVGAESRGGFSNGEGFCRIKEDCQRGEKEFCAGAKGKGGEWLTLSVENPRLWSAEEPFCYKLTLTLMEESQSVDEISLRIWNASMRWQTW